LGDAAVSYQHTAAVINMATFLGVFVDCCSLGPMAASSGFRGSLGHAALVDAICVAPAHLQGLQNKLQWRYISMSSLILSLTITIAK
jgi:hypothetical protein